MKLMDSKFKTGKWKYYFIQRGIKMWNELPVDVVMATRINNFKGELDQ